MSEEEKELAKEREAKVAEGDPDTGSIDRAEFHEKRRIGGTRNARH